MAGFSIDEILNKNKAAAPAGQALQVVMLPAENIEPNPENSIYEIGDVSMLKADIAERGLRSPLEVLPAKNGKYMLLAGHRRWTACRELAAENVPGFALLPCVVRESHGSDDDLIALITSNATARELTDGERLRQYLALKKALENKKAAGNLDGRVRDAMSRITGDGTGTLGRLNSIATHCTPQVLEMLSKGEIGITRAYECSRLYKVQQEQYAKTGWSSMPNISSIARRAAIKYLVEDGLADQLRRFDYVEHDDWNYYDNLDARKMVPITLEIDTVGALRLEAKSKYTVTVQQLDNEDGSEVTAEADIGPRDYFDQARKLYADPVALKKKKQAESQKKTAEKARQAQSEKWEALASEKMQRFDDWKKVAQAKELGLVFREYPTADGGRIVVMADEATRNDKADGIPYENYFVARFDADGRRINRDGSSAAMNWFCQWYGSARLDALIAADLKTREGSDER